MFENFTAEFSIGRFVDISNIKADLIRLLCDAGIDLARNGNSGCANEILGCAKCHF